MPKLDWGNSATNVYETGVSNGVLYPGNGIGVAWPGLIGINETPKDAAFKPLYQDGVKTHTSMDLPSYSSTLQAYMYPDEFELMDGTAEIAPGLSVEEQSRRPFGLSYKTLLGGESPRYRPNYKIHLVYNALVLPTTKDYQTMTNTSRAMPFSWEISTTPVVLPGIRPASHFIVDTRKLGYMFVQEFERILYGSDNAEARMPSPEELVSIFKGS